MSTVYTKTMMMATALGLVIGATATGAVVAQQAPGSSSAIDRGMDGQEGLRGADSMGRSTTEGAGMKDTMDAKTDAGAVGTTSQAPVGDGARAADAVTNDAAMGAASEKPTKAAKPMKATKASKKTSMKTGKSDSMPLAAWVRPAGSSMDAKPQVVALSSNSEQPSVAYPPTTYANGGMVSNGTTMQESSQQTYSNTTTVTPVRTNATATNANSMKTAAPVGAGVSTNNQANSTGSRMGSGLTGTTANTVAPAAGESDTMGSTTGGSMRGGATQDNDIMKR